MGIPGSANLMLLGGGAPAYEIEQSLRFDMSGTPTLTRTAGTATDGKKCTFSFWIKKCETEGGVDPAARFAEAYSGTGNQFHMQFGNGSSADIFAISPGENPLTQGIRESDATFRDPSAWYHFMWRWDSVNGISKIYANGVELSSSITTAPTTNSVTSVTKSGTTLTFGKANSNAVEMYVAELHLIDGQIKDTTDFGEFDESGVWRPIEYTGTYGNNGAYLKFDPSATNGVGHDHSGNGNNFTASGFTTTGTGTDVMSDTPTNNYATMNPLAVRVSYVPTFSEGNLKVTHRSGTGQYSHCGSTFAFKSDDSSGFYCEVQNGAESYGGVSLIVTDYGVHNLHPDVSNGFSTNTNGGIGYDSNGYIRNFGTTIDYTSSASYNGGSDILGIAVKDNKIWFSINGSWIASGNPSTGANPVITLSSTQTFVVGSYGQGSRTFIKNFGQRAFAYTVPTGFKAMNTSNLPAPDIADGSDYFNTLLYTGDGTAPRSLTGVGFQPDWVWVKARDQAWWHVLGDSVRGSSGTNGLNLNTNDTAFEGDENSGHVESWDSDGFTVEQADSGANPLVNVNNNGSPYVAWNWKAGGTASSNTAGTITTTVSASPSSGFSILTYTGNATSGATIGHGLGVAPSWVIVKNRDSGTQPWRVYHSSLGATKALRFDIDTVQETDTAYWNNTAPSGTVITLGNDNSTNANGDKYIAYCFAEVEGYSKISEFTGNGSTDGSFVYCGFKPSWILLRRYAASRNWYLYDAARNTFNVVGTNLFPDLPNAEGTADALDIVSNGFKMRTTNTSTNGSGDKILFVAFASNPFGGSGVSPATAR